MKKLIPFIPGVLFSAALCSQQPNDTTSLKELKEVTIKSWMRRDINRLPLEQDGFLYSGKKNEGITLSATNANIALKTARQLFSKVPGVFVYDMDGSGNQLNISTRGLDPHRSWEFNVRQNNVLINSDIYGYPASHYSAPMESIEKIELVRGTGALQYGAQFGGMINYVTKKPDTAKGFSLESINTIGSYNLLSNYNAVSGTYKKLSYFAYYYRRNANGYRKNSESTGEAQFLQLQYRFTDRITLKAEVGRSKYWHRIPGPLNDSMFASNPRMSTRGRNYFSPDISVPSLMLNWRISNRTNLYLTASGVFGNRSSVQLDAFANVPDMIDPSTGAYKNRQVDIDNFHSRTAESRLVHTYTIGKLQNKLATGLVYMNNDLRRRQLGKGTTGSDYVLTRVTSSFGRDINFKSENLALFAENAISLSRRWTVSPGLRYEEGRSDMSGTITYYPANELPNRIAHRFLLLGISTQYQLNLENTIYGGISESYRPVIFKDIVPASTYEQVNKDLKDATGYNAEAGVRGQLFNHLQYDISAFRILYKNRLGTLVLQNSIGQPYIYRTNIGDTRTTGVEAFLQYKFPLNNALYAGIFTSTAYMYARYLTGEVSTGSSNKSIRGNRVEAVPTWISRNGIDLLYKGFSASLLYSYTSATFSDALNTAEPPPTGAKGYTPEYGIWDINTSLRANAHFTFRAGINNLFNKQYFTKRPTFYPGPGIWPSDGRNAYVTVAIKI